MGNAVSEPVLQRHLVLLSDFAGDQKLDQDNQVWRQLFALPVPLSQLPPSQVEQHVTGCCDQLVSNNGRTQNFQTLLLKTLDLIAGSQKNEARATAATNGVYLLRVLFKRLSESLNAVQLAAFSTDAPYMAADIQPTAPLLDQLLRMLLKVLTVFPTSGQYYLLHVEVVNLLLVLTSTQLYSTSPSAPIGSHPFIDALMQQRQLAPQLVQQALKHYSFRPPLPPKVQLWSPSPDADNKGVLRLVRSAAASVLWLPFRAYTFLIRLGFSQTDSTSPLADSSLLLLLVLINHSPQQAHVQQGPPQPHFLNPYQAAIQGLQDSEDVGTDAESGRGQTASGISAVPFSGLYNALGAGLDQEPSVLLLYVLLHKCHKFQQYVLVRSDADTILLPLLHRLYNTSYKTPSQLYMLLIIILILSQDKGFSQNVQEVMLGSVPWYKERMLQKTSLGSLLVVLLLRTAHYNMSKLKDVYMHQNTLAALANVAPHMSGMYQRIGRRSQSGSLAPVTPLGTPLGTPYLTPSPSASPGQLAAEHAVYADFMRTILEIINTIITTGLRQNPEMVYALLHRQDVFEPFRMHARFADILDNVQVVIDSFNQKVDSAQHREGWSGSVTDVLGIIKENLSSWQSDRLSRQEELRFSYEEEGAPQDFFVPYVWSLVVSSTTIPWNLQAIALFQPVTSPHVTSPHEDVHIASQQLQQLTVEQTNGSDDSAKHHV
ncbi:MAG: hypothetical protein FRX49_01050 [Trebouxia sp. A1-2]|nr:MAG: hypothetical protein FRX49_01050 [Trebouxia sp. A1-2]